MCSSKDLKVREETEQAESGSNTGKCTSWPITFPPSLWTPARIPFLCSYSISSFKTPLMPPLSTVTLSSSALTESVGQHYQSPHLHSQNPLLASFPLSASLHSSQLVTYCHLDSYTPHPDSTIALLFQYRDDHPLTISSLCTFFTLQKILLLPSSFFPL